MVHGETLEHSMIIRHACFILSSVQTNLTVQLGLGFSKALVVYTASSKK